MPLQPFVETPITVKGHGGENLDWTVELVPGTVCDTYIFRPAPKAYHPGKRLTPGPCTTHWTEEDWARWFASYDKRLSEYESWFNRCVWMYTNLKHDLALLRQWGIV